MENFDYEFNGMPPCFQAADKVFYITRGRRPETDMPRLKIAEWRRWVQDDVDFQLDEIYTQLNVSSGYRKSWCERGRAQWLRPPGIADEWFHFTPARIAYLVGGSYRGGRIAERHQILARDIGQDPSLESWLAYVSDSRDLELQEDISASGRSNRASQIGRAVWLQGDPEKDVFHYLPAAVWTPMSLRPGRPLDEHTEFRYAAGIRIAAQLNCRIWRGLEND